MLNRIDLTATSVDPRGLLPRAPLDVTAAVETITESDKPEVAKKIREHVEAMHQRIKSGKGIRLRDPLFAEIFKHSDKIAMTVEKTEKA